MLDFAQSSGRLPREGSIREAIFLGVWLRRQEIESGKIQLLAQGILDVVVGKDVSGTSKVFSSIVDLMYPHLKTLTSTKDADLKAQMEKEVSKGILHFSPVVMKSLKQTVHKITVPDSLKKKIEQKALKQRK